jgi:murein DD-endopeptidase MepM/ murein hydrolase activator NlpD
MNQDFREKINKTVSQISPVISFDPSADTVCNIDLSSKNSTLTEDITSDTARFSEYIDRVLRIADARYAIGGYNELRSMYSRSEVFSKGEEPRRLHLGTDIWGLSGTAVYAPLDGKIHSFAFNDKFGDYGATLILTHVIDDFTFHTLYGHLSLASLENISQGDKVASGSLIGYFGNESENGSWPPHLHFQIINNIGNYKGDYPGVCAFSQREQWLSNSPDPDSLLQLNRYISRNMGK